MKRKILLCALSFIAIALFSCGIAFLPNWNPKPTTPPSDIGQEEGGSGDDVTEAYTGRIRYYIRNYIYYTENGQEKTAQCPNMQESFATLNFSVGITQGGVDYNMGDTTDVATTNSFSTPYSKSIDAGWLIYAAPKIKLNSITYNNYDVNKTYADFVTLKEIYVGAAATEQGTPSKGSEVSESTLKSGYDTGVRLNNDANDTVSILVSIYWEGKPLDFEVQFDDPDSTADYTLTASVDFGTPLPNILNSTFFSGHGMNSLYAGVNFEALNVTGKYCRSASNKRNSSYVPTLVNNVIISSDISGVSIGHYDYIAWQAVYYSGHEDQYTSIDQYLCSESFDKYYEYDGSNWNLTGEDNEYMMNHIYLGLVYPETNMTLDRNGGSGGTSSIRAMYRTAIMQESITVPTRTGYRFAGYEYNDSLVYNSSGVLQTNTNTALSGDFASIYLWNTILGNPEAQWTPNTYSVTFYRNTSSTDNTQSTQSGFTYDQSKALQAKPTDWEKEGYTFKGWSTSRTAITATYTNGQSVENLTSINGGTVSLYAVWAPNTYSVTFYRNTSSSDTTTSTQSGFTYDQSKALQAKPTDWTKEGYRFIGWSTSRTATTATYTNGQSVKNLTTSGTVNLYAVWALNSYTLTIDPNGGTYNGKTGSQAVSGLYTQTTTIAAPTRYGYNFAGWAISGGNGTLSTFGKVCSASTDPLFTTSNNNVGVYNNDNDKSVTHTLISASSAGLSNWISGGRVLRVTYTGSCTWGNGLVQSISTSANKVFYTMIYAKVPVGYTLEPAYNASGTGATRTWMTSNQGTGNWQTYVMRWNCGSSGEFSTIGFWYLLGPSASSSNPVDLDIAYLCSFDATGLSSTTGVATSPFVYTYGTSNVTLLALWEETWINHTTPFSGSGTEEDPYIIASAENLAYLSKQVYDGQSTYSSQYFKQTADIDLTKYNWQPIGVEYTRAGSSVYCYFSGVYDGNGYTISGLHTPKGSGSLYLAQGLFGMVLVRNTTEIRNVTLENVDVRGGDCVGGLAGWVLSIYDNETVTIENCSVNGKTYGDDSVGGLIGKIETRERGIVEVINCDSDVSVGSLQEDIGGIVGNVENEDGIGKIVISLCNNYGDVVANSGTYVGGIVGCFDNTSSTTACLTLDQNANFGQIQGMQDVGGIIGSARDIANITNNSNMGNVSIIGGNESVAGIAGYFHKGTISGNTSFGDITGVGCVGGLVGYLETAIMSSNQVEGTISGNIKVGGLVGYVTSDFASATDCAVNADVIVSSTTDNNGLFGRLANSFGITNCYFIGDFKNSSGTALSMTSFTGGGISPIVTNSYIIANGNAPVKKYTSLSSFKESWTIVSGVNDNNPIQKELFYLAGYTGGDEMLRVWLEDRNILSDPSFEGSDWAAQIGTSELSTEHARSGQHSWKMTEVGASYGETYSRTITAYQIDPTHKYFVRMYAYQEVQHGGIQAYWQDKEPSIGSTTLGPAGQWNMYGWRFDRVGFSGSQFFRIDFEHHNQVGELWVDDVLLIDLTAMYGAGNEPSQEECMILFA